jgi:hypothetical protein
MNKNGFILSARELVGLVIGIIILGLFVSCGSQILPLIIGQAQDNFEDFTKEIDDLGKNGKDGEKRIFVLILDRNTKIANYWNTYISEDFIRCAEGVEEHWKPTGNNCNGKDCLCLIKTFTIEETGLDGKLCLDEREIRNVLPTATKCVETPDEYYIFGRNWADEWDGFGNTPRRIQMTMMKKGNGVFICEGTCVFEEGELNFQHSTKSKK